MRNIIRHVFAPAVAVLYLAVCGCGQRSSGLIGGIHVLDVAVVVEDRFYPCSAVVGFGDGVPRLTAATGWFVPMIESGPFVVTYDSTRTLRDVRKSRLNEGTRLPKWLDDRTLSGIDVRTGAPFDIANTLDNNDDGIVRLRVKGASLIAEVAARYHVGVGDAMPRYFVYTLPDGPWQPISTSDGRAALNARRVRYAFEDLRDPAAAQRASSRPAGRAAWARAQSFAELSSAGLDSGDWGKLMQRRVSNKWETVFVAPGGGEWVVLRENDGGFAQKQGALLNRQPLP